MFIRSGYSAQTRRTRSVGGTGGAGGGETDSGTEHHDHAADVLVGRLDHERRLGAKAGLHALALEFGDAEQGELDRVALDGEPPRRPVGRAPILRPAEGAPIAWLLGGGWH